MAKFNINVNKVKGDILNADTINLTRVEHMTSQEKEKNVEELLEKILRLLENLDDNHAFKKEVKQSLKGVEPGSEEFGDKIKKTLSLIKSGLGDTASIVMDTIKIAQLLGM